MLVSSKTTFYRVTIGEKMLIDCISDLHGHYPKLSGGNILIVAGDLCANDSLYEQDRFHDWLSMQDYESKLYLAGNHDTFLINNSFYESQHFLGGSCQFNGLKIYGSPWSKSFPRMNPKCKAFTCPTEDGLREKFKQIPDNTDILITHTPPYGILDETASGEHVGSKALLEEVLQVKPRFHLFGHVHEQGGKQITIGETTFVNCSHVDEHYNVKHEATRIKL